MDSSTVDRIRASLPQNGSEKAPVKFTNKHGQTATMNTENIGKRDALGRDNGAWQKPRCTMAEVRSLAC